MNHITCNTLSNGGRSTSQLSVKETTSTWHAAVQNFMPRPEARKSRKLLGMLFNLTCLCLIVLGVSFNPARAASVVSSPTAAGMVYYVATTGNDANTGTSASPWRTIKKGVSSLHAGDTLYIKSGVYKQSTTLPISVSGTSTAPITISTDPTSTSLAVISGDTNGDGQGDVPAKGSWVGLVQIRGSYVRFQNLEVAYSGGNVLDSNGAHNTLSGLKVHHGYRTGIQVEAADTVVEKNTVWRNAESNYCGGSVGRLCNGNWGAGIAWGLAHDVTPPGSAARMIVRNNTVYNNSGEGIICMHTDNALIDSNVVYDNWALQIDLDQCSYSTIQKNLVYATSNQSWWRRTTGPGTGIMLSNEGIAGSNGATYPVGHDRKVINNIMVGNGSNFYFWKASLAGSALKNDLIADNTMVNAAGGSATGLKIDAASHSNTRIANNIVLQPSGTVAYAGSTSGLTFGNNLWSRTPATNVRSSTDVISNPNLADPNHTITAGGVQSAWYKLKDTTSPAINHGQSLSTVTLDFWNASRGSMPDIGANELVP